ncbi:reverse transcriptase domain-containing protein [Polynucleobacter sp.]|uniref:reverse transcriptase domain-containing protein n=1 Tax=Polynucleobacter sp. TaxID=2029855 RepID=UPI003F6982F5
MKRHKNLIEQIASIENLRSAYSKTSKNKRKTYGYLEFKEYSHVNLSNIREELLDGSYKIGGYRQFVIYEPKARLISALDFNDRLIQHALCNVIGPIFESTLLHNTFACRPGMGTHAGVRYIQSELRKDGATHYLKTDYSKFFPSIDRAILHRLIDRKIGCELTLKILREIIPLNGKGIPIGSLTSQLFANVYGGLIDRYIHNELGHRRWARYMDDIVILGDDPVRLRNDFYRIQEFSKDHMNMNISKWSCSGVGRGINFLGYRIWDTHKLLRPDSVLRAKRKISNMVRHDDQESLDKFIASWTGHAAWADTHNLFTWMENKHELNTYY